MNIPAKFQQIWPSVLGGEVIEIVNMDEHKHGQRTMGHHKSSHRGHCPQIS